MKENKTVNKSPKHLKVLLWNVECTAGYRHGNNALLPLLNGIDIKNEEKPDIIILNEFYKLHDYNTFKIEFEQSGYVVFEDSRVAEKGENQILIAVLKKIDGIDFEQAEIINPTRENSQKMPNLLSVSLRYKGKPLAIIGTRIRCGNGTEQDYTERKNEFDELIKLIDNFQEKAVDVLIAGDFNHARLLHSQDADLTADEINAIYDGYLQKEYNYHSIKLECSKRALKVCTPNNEVGSIKNKRTRSIGAIKLDHLIIPNTMAVEDEVYIFNEYSDHAMLQAKIKI